MIKNFARLVIAIHAMLFRVAYKQLGLQYKTVAIMLSKYSGIYGILLRRAFYKKSLQRCGDGLSVFYGAFIVFPDVEIGNNCSVGEYSIVSLCSLGNDVLIAARVSIMSGSQHHDVMDTDSLFRESTSIKKRIVIGNNVWIGTHAVIMSDVSSDTAVGAGAVVVKQYEPYLVVAGVPAIPIKTRR